MPNKKTYKVKGEIYDISESEQQDFLKDFPDAEEVKTFIHNKDTFDIPLADVNDFENDMPEAKAMHEDSETEVNLESEKSLEPTVKKKMSVDGSTPDYSEGLNLRQIPENVQQSESTGVNIPISQENIKPGTEKPTSINTINEPVSGETELINQYGSVSHFKQNYESMLKNSENIGIDNKEHRQMLKPTQAKNYLSESFEREFSVNQSIENLNKTLSSYPEDSDDRKYVEGLISAEKKELQKVVQERYNLANESISNYMDILSKGYVEKTNVNQPMATGQPGLSSQQTVKEEITDQQREYYKDEIKRLKRIQDGFFNKPKKEQVKVAISENKQELETISDIIPEGSSPEEALNIYFNTLITEKESLEQQYGYGQDEPLERAKKLGGAIFGHSDERLRYLELEQKIKSIAPIALLNRSSFTGEEEGAAEVFGRTFMDTLAPGYTDQTQREEATDVQDIVSKLGVEKSVNPEILKSVKDLTTYENYSAKDWASMAGTTSGIMLPFVFGSGALSAVTRGSKVFTGLTNLAKNGKLTGKTSAYVKGLMGEGKLANGVDKTLTGFNKLLFGGIEEGIKYETVGQIFRNQSEEANFASGFAGGVGGRVATKVFQKTTLPIINNLFGKSTNQFLELSKKFLDKTANLTGKGVGESVEEFAQETVGVWKNTEAGKDFDKLFEERFGDASENLHFFVSTFVMGAGMGGAGSIDQAFKVENKKAYEKLTTEEKKQADEFIEEQENLTNTVIGNLSQEEDVQQELESVNEPTEVTSESVNEFFGVDKKEKGALNVLIGTDEEVNQSIEEAKTKKVSESTGRKAYLKTGDGEFSYGTIEDIDGETVFKAKNGTEYVLSKGNTLADEEVLLTPETEEVVEEEHKVSEVDVSDTGFTIRGKDYTNQYSKPDEAINTDSDGNVISVTLTNENNESRTFKDPEIVDELAYNIWLSSKVEEVVNNEEELIKFIEDEQSSSEEQAIEKKSKRQQRRDAKEAARATKGKNRAISNQEKGKAVEQVPEAKKPEVESKPEVIDEPTPEYKGSHSAPVVEEGTSLDNMSSIFPDSPTDPNFERYYGMGGDYSKADKETIEVMKSAEGNPDAEITVYRAVPKGSDINGGDWVSTSKEYATKHGETVMKGDYELVSKKVKAKELNTDGDLHEWGYNPDSKTVEEVEETDSGKDSEIKSLLNKYPSIDRMSGLLKAGDRQRIIELITGVKPSKAKAGINALKDALKQYIGVTSDSAKGETDQINEWAKSETKKEAPKSKEKENIVSVPVKSITTNEEQFQNREDLDKERVKDIADNWDDNKYDPITVLEEDGEYTILSGHHRLAAAQLMGKSDLDVKIFKGTKAEAKTFAINSNTFSQEETHLERAKVYRGMRESGTPESEIKAEAKKAHGKNSVFITHLSHLNPKSKIMGILDSFRDNPDVETNNKINAIADWIGLVKSRHTDLSLQQENEMFDYLMDSYSKKKGAGKITNKAQFSDLANVLIDRLKSKGEFNESSVLNFSNNLGKTSLEIEYDKNLEEAKSNLKAAEKELSDKRADLLSRGAVKEDLDRILPEYENRVQKALNELTEIRKNKGILKEEVKSQTSIFDEAPITPEEVSKTEKEITAENKAKADQRIKDARKAFRNKLGAGSGPQLQALPEFIELVKAYTERGAITVKEFIDNVRDLIDLKYSDKDIQKAYINVLKGNKTSLKERKSAQNFMNRDDISDEVKKALNPNARFYVPKQNNITSAEAEAIFQTHGIDEVTKQVMDQSNGMSPAVRVVLAEKVIQEHDRLAQEATDQTVEEKHISDAADVAENIFELGTRLGQGIQAFAIWGAMNPRMMLSKAKRRAQKQGIELTPEQEKELKKLAKAIEKSPEGFQKNRAIINFENAQYKMYGVSKLDVAMSVWYAHILSGYKTQALNFMANAAQVASEMFVSAIYKPKSLPFLFKGLYNGLGRGLWEAKSVWSTGYSPLKSSKTEMGGSADALENIPKKGAWNVLRAHKYVARLMNATDTLFFHGLKGMRAYELAHAEAVRKNKIDPTVKINEQVREELYNTKSRVKEAEDKARSEGLKGRDFKMRVYEIMEQSRPVEIQDDTNDFGSRGTFNYEPEGLLGALTHQISNFTENFNIKGAKPLKFVIPFTRVISNVTNAYLDWSPYGFSRAITGGAGQLYSGSNTLVKRKYTPEQRAKEYIKATTGTVALASLYAMFLGHDEEDDEKPFMEITANGTGDYRKNFNLKKTGWLPYSIRIGDRYFSYKNTPLAIPFTAIAILADKKKYKGVDLAKKEWYDKVGMSLWGTIQYTQDMTFLSGLAGFMDVFNVDNPDGSMRAMEKWAINMGKGFLVPNLVTQVSRKTQEIMDMPMKEANTFSEIILRDLPVARDSQRDMINSLGEDVVPSMDRFTSTNTEDPIWQLVIDKRAWLGKPNRNVSIYDMSTRTEREMNDDEFYQYVKISGSKTKDYIERNFNMLERLSGPEAKKKIKAAMTKYRKEAKKQVAINMLYK